MRDITAKEIESLELDFGNETIPAIINVGGALFAFKMIASVGDHDSIHLYVPYKDPNETDFVVANQIAVFVRCSLYAIHIGARLTDDAIKFNGHTYESAGEPGANISRFNRGRNS